MASDHMKMRELNRVAQQVNCSSLPLPSRRQVNINLLQCSDAMSGREVFPLDLNRRHDHEE
jgi:hypothetical protein